MSRKGNGQMAWNVLIVDDEALIRTGLRLSVPWEDLGFKVIAEAGTAMEAMDKLERHSVDLALVDIQMPGTNGIEFIREVKGRFPHIKTLIISGHSNFEYTVSALKLSVCDYLLKPINLEQLIDTIKTIRDKLESEEKNNQVLRGQRMIVGKMFVLRLLGKDFKNLEEINDYCSQYGIAFPLENYCVSTMRIHKFSQMIETHYQGQRSVFEAAFDEYLQKNLKDEQTLFAALVGDYYTVLAETADMERMRGLLYAKAKEEGMQVTIGTGEAFEDIFFMDVSYLQAIDVIRQKNGKSQKNDKKTVEIRMSYACDMMIKKLEERNFKEARALADKVFTDYLYEDSGEVLNWCVQSLYRIVDYFQLSRYEEMKGISNFAICTIRNLYFITTMQSVYSEKIQRICTFLKDLKGGSNDAIVAKVMKMVKEKYADPELSLQKIAADLGISYNYLSTIFKQISGENFSSYLTKIKMNHAKQLVMEGKLKMYEIAEQVGYVNAKYFAEQFKKSVGMTPSEYKSHNLSQEE